MAYRIERLEKIFEREIGTILCNSKDNRLKFVTVTKVRVTNDLSFATIFYTVIGSEEQKEGALKNLENAKGFIKSSLGKSLEIRKIPDLIFKYDDSLEYGNHIDEILKGLKL